jgi:hypothetical protein
VAYARRLAHCRSGQSDVRVNQKEIAMNVPDLISRTKIQMQQITGLPAETVSRCNQAETGWMLGIDMLEHRSVPRTQDLLASFEVNLDENGTITSWRRTGRFLRNQNAES